ncbi:hypothetical protein ONZ45_g15510 [Pleurotus djamor]|nr:hypothetical protein ONZ45_g15510 [Pleurotus djamor]
MAIATDFAAQNLVDEEIVAEIKQHTARIKALKIRRNSYCAVNRLPDDVLKTILLFVKSQAEMSASSRMFTSRPYSQWVVLLSVCYAWHDLIMDDPRFWSTINLNTLHAPRMLDLSKSAPLEIQLRVHTNAGEGLWSLVTRAISQSHRLKRLEMHLPDSTALSTCFNLIAANSAPHLELLSIVVDTETGDVSWAVWSTLPSLRWLDLYQAPLPLITHFESMPHLTRLNITLSGNTDQRVTVPWLLRTLNFLPNIQTLSISSLYGPSVDPTAQQVSLPSLRTLGLCSGDATTLSILNNLTPPPSSSISIYYEVVEIDSLRVTDLTGLKLAMSRISSPATSIHAVDISFCGIFELTIHLREDGPDPARFLSPCIYCSFPSLPEEDTHIFLKLCEVIPLAEISSLSLSWMSPTHGLSFIPSSPKVKTLVLHHCDIQVLRTLNKSNLATHPPNPELRYILFQDTCFYNRRGHKNGMYVVLRNILRERKQYMIPIKKVTFEGCEIRESQVKYLQELVEVVRK